MRYDVNKIPAWLSDRFSKSQSNPKELRLGWTIYEEIGITVINEYAIGKISVNYFGDPNTWDMT